MIQRYYADRINMDKFNNNGNVVIYADHLVALEAVVKEYQEGDPAWDLVRNLHKQVDTLTAENTRLREVLRYIAEYWNGNENLMATTDAANMARNTAKEALKIKEAEFYWQRK